MFSWLLYATFGRGRISPKAAYDTHHVVLYVAVSASPYCGYTYTGPRKEIAADLQRCFRQNEMAVSFPLHVVLYAAVSAILGIWNARRCGQSIRVDGPSVPEGDNEHGVRKYRPYYSDCGTLSKASNPVRGVLGGGPDGDPRGELGAGKLRGSPVRVASGDLGTWDDGGSSAGATGEPAAGGGTGDPGTGARVSP